MALGQLSATVLQDSPWCPWKIKLQVLLQSPESPSAISTINDLVYTPLILCACAMNQVSKKSGETAPMNLGLGHELKNNDRTYIGKNSCLLTKWCRKESKLWQGLGKNWSHGKGEIKCTMLIYHSGVKYFCAEMKECEVYRAQEPEKYLTFTCTSHYPVSKSVVRVIFINTFTAKHK